MVERTAWTTSTGSSLRDEPELIDCLDLFYNVDIKTWFCPGHTLETFPEEMRSVIDNGPTWLCACETDSLVKSWEEEKILLKTSELCEQFLGKRP